MSISDLYSSGKHKQEIGHFASIVKIAKTDGIISEGEQLLLDRAAKKLNINEEEDSIILKRTTYRNFPTRFARVFILTPLLPWGKRWTTREQSVTKNWKR